MNTKISTFLNQIRNRNNSKLFTQLKGASFPKAQWNKVEWGKASIPTPVIHYDWATTEKSKLLSEKWKYYDQGHQQIFKAWESFIVKTNRIWNSERFLKSYKVNEQPIMEIKDCGAVSLAKML